jgi:hypothetical protein
MAAPRWVSISPPPLRTRQFNHRMDTETAALAVIGRRQVRFDGSDITVRTLAGRLRGSRKPE